MLAICFFALPARAQPLGATMITSLTATQGETLAYTVVITNRTGSNITSVTFSDALDPNTMLVAGSVNTSPLAFPDSYSTVGNVQLTVPVAQSVLNNDVDPDGTGGLTVTSFSALSANGGNVNVAANGSFTYNPPPGFSGTDTFTYTVNDGEGFTDMGTVSVSVGQVVWFINNSAAGPGDGRFTSPFNSIANFNALAADDPGDYIFVYQGAGAYSGTLTLLNNQQLIGHASGLTISPNLSIAAGSRPTIANVTLASGNTVMGLNISASSGTALSGASVGTLTVNAVAVTNTAGTAVNLAGGTLNVALGSVAAAGGANGIRLVNCTGSFTVSGDGASAQNGTGGTIQNTTGNGVHLDSAVNVSLARMNINNSAANGIFGQNVNGLVIDWCSLFNNGDATDEAGLRLGDPVAAVNGLTGTAPAGANPTRIANTLIRASGEMNVAIFNNGGTLSQLEVTNVISKDTRTRPLGADGFYFESRGNASATVNFTSCSFSNNFTQGLQALALAQSALTINVNNCGFTNNNEGIVVENAVDADIIFDLNGNRFFNNLATGASGSAIAAVNATTVTGNAIYSGKIRNNTVSGGGIDNHLIAVLLAGAGLNTLQVSSNNINAANSQFSGVFVQAGETGSGNLNANVTVVSNTVSLGALGSHGIVVQSRITSTLCAEIAGNVSTTGGAGLFGINVRQRDTSTYRLPGFAGPFNSTAAVTAFLSGKNPSSTIGATVATTYSGGAACVLPLLALPLESQRDSVHQPKVARNELPWVNSDEAGTTPTGLRQSSDAQGGNPVEVDSSVNALPRVGAEHQPWADRHNPIGIESSVAAESLSPATLKPILAAARQRWVATGLTSDQVAVLDSLHFEVADLAGWFLGASSNHVVRLDRSATGYGWFIDPTPNDDGEFSAVAASHKSAANFGASDAANISAALSRDAATSPAGIDLLTAVLHEMGHNLGLADEYAPASRESVMYGFLTPGERRLPTRGQACGAVSDAGLGTHYMFTPINLGTLPPGKSITITFRATVANPMPPGVCIITNQGTVTANGGISILTDDPRTAPLLDATLTSVFVPPFAVTQAASAITGGSATLNGTVNPCGTASSYYFQYGTTTAYGSNTVTNTVPSGFAPVPVSVPIAGLQPAVTYHFRLVATNSYGTNAGADLTFTTPLTITQQPTNAAACVGSTAVFSVAANSPSVTYQWQRFGAGSFTNVNGATAMTYTTPTLTAADDGAAFRVVVSAPGTNLISAVARLSVISLTSPAVTYNFNSGLPANTAIYGSAFVDAAAGVLELNTNAGSLTGAFLTTDLAPGRVVNGFAATFKVRITPGTSPPADGFSFNWATDLPFGVYGNGEEGQGNGLSVCFDTFDNGLGEAPAIDVKWRSNVIAHTSVPLGLFLTAPAFADVRIRLNPDATLDVLFNCQPIYARLPLPGVTPFMGARFGLASRTGGLWESHTIDDLALQVFLDPTNGVPRITNVATQTPSGMLVTGTGTPNQNYSVEASTDLVAWTWRANVVANGGGVWQFFEPSIAAPPYRFYRLRAAPQFPTGLINWWRAESNYVDSFGPYHGTPINGLGFAVGQRGQAFSLDGTNHAMFIGGTAVAVPWTACFWVKRQDATDFSASLLADPGSGLKLEQYPFTRQVGFTQFGVADYSFPYVLPTNVWTHLAFVAAPGGIVLYTNGIAAATNAATISLPRGTVGSRDNGTDHMKGLLDETTLFNRALAPAEIQRVIDATRGP